LTGAVRSHAARAQAAPWLTGAVWACVALAVNLSGNRFDATSFKQLWQLVPYENLVADPFGSVWNLHIQPPVWNLVVGLVGRWSPLPEGISFQLLMLGFGVAAAVLLCDTLRLIGVRAWWAAALTLFAMCEPDVVVNAFEPRYELAVTTGVVAVAWLIARGSARHGSRDRWFALVATAATAVTMTRTIYHPVWLVVLLGGLAWIWRHHLSRRWVLSSACIPLVVVGGWMLKNEYLVGRFTLNTWAGMNLQRAVIGELHPEDRAAMLASGELSKVSAVNSFASYDFYVPAVGPCTKRWGSPVLDRLTRDGPFAIPNFNAGCFLPVYDLARDDALNAIRQHPDAYVRGRLWSGRRWFELDETFTRSKSLFARADQRVYRILDVGLPGTWGVGDRGAHFSVLVLVCTIAVVVAGLFSRRRRAAEVWQYVAFLTVWTFAVGVLFELGEQPRFRSTIDPLVITFGIAAIASAVAQRRVSPAATAAPSSQQASSAARSGSPTTVTGA